LETKNNALATTITIMKKTIATPIHRAATIMLTTTSNPKKKMKMKGFAKL